MEHNFCLLLMITAGIICQLQAQGSTIRPIRHSLHPGGRQSLDGSLPNGGCTSVNGDICNLQDGGTSVLVDNTIPPLNGLNGDWARDLYTVNRTTSFISIGFDFGTSVRVRRVELVLFNCQQRSIRAGSIQIYTDAVTNLFPRPDPPSVGTFVGERLFGVGIDSCANLYRVCVPLLGANNRIYYIALPRTAGSNRVYLAETIFYNDNNICGPDTLVTEPVTPPPFGPDTLTGQANTSLAVSITKRPSLETSPGTSITQTEINNNNDTTSTELPWQTILIAVITTAIVLSTIIVVALHIPLYVSYRRLISTTDVTSRNTGATGATMADNNDTDSTHDYVYMESTALKLQENDAYGTSQIMRREACT